MEYELYLCHHGVKGMKWGVRKKNPYKARTVRGHAGPGRYVGSNERRLEKAKSDLKRLDNGEHLSIGATKERQAALDNRDRYALNNKISKMEEKLEKKAMASKLKDTYKKIQTGEIVEAFDYNTGAKLGYFDAKTGKPVPYGEVSDAISYMDRRNATAFIGLYAGVAATTFAIGFLSS